jgi:hypothetical protein
MVTPMSDANRHRPSIDLDELERQLREAARPRQAAAAGSAEASRPAVDDPLAELARIVGQDDPFRGAFHSQRGVPVQPASPPPRQEPAIEWQPEHEAAAPSGEAETGARVVAFDDYVRSAGPQPAPARTEYLQAETEPVYEPEGLLPQHDDDFIEEESGRRFRFNGKLIGAVAAALVAVAGIGLALTMRGGSSTQLAANKQPPVIKADTGPTKVAPQNPGGVEVPDQNKQIYERGMQDAKAAKIVGGDEQPVDVAQTTRADAPADASAAQQTSTGVAMPKPAATQPAIPGLGPPRVVKTVPVRPDGSVADGSQAAPARTMAMVPPPPPMAIPGMTTGALPQDSAAGQAKLPPAPTPPVSTALGTPPKPKAVPTETITATTAAPPALNTPAPKPSATAQNTPVAKPAAPVQSTPPAPAPARQQVASTQPVAPVDSTATAAAAGAGGFAVQLAAPASEQEAKDTLSRLQKRFVNELGTYKLGVRRADVGDRTVYRVRVSNLTREDANVLCTKLQAAGGVCFIAKN